MKDFIIDDEELKNIEVSILEEIDDICKKHNLKYYIMYGSLLGAVRHKGFIPWDDDMDITMPVEDYYKFIDIFNKECDEKYYLFSYVNDKNYHLPYGKVKRIDTLFLEKSIANSKVKSKGIFVDVFPMYYYHYKNENDFVKDINNFRLLAGIACNKQKLNVDFGKKAYILSKLVPFTPSYLIKKATAKFSRKTGDLYLIPGLDTKIIKKENFTFSVLDFAEGKEIEFENRKFIAPKNAEKILTQIYGDYMQLPPIEKRVSNHGTEEIRYLSKHEYNEIINIYRK